jgi:hypothetical protein
LLKAHGNDLLELVLGHVVCLTEVTVRHRPLKVKGANRPLVFG